MVFTLENLIKENFAQKSFAVLGFPIAHSLSPLMQNKALEFLKIPDSKYYAFEVAPENLGDALNKFSDKNFCGLNLTIPHKSLVFDFVKNISGEAKAIGACNVLKNMEGQWCGFNTDTYGIEKALECELNFSLRDSTVLIFGAGGASRAAAFKAFWNGAKKVYISNRSKERLESLLADLQKYGFSANEFSEENAKEISLIINTTSLGLKDEDNAVCDFSKFKKDVCFFDSVYRTGKETVSVKSAKQVGLKACDGLSMLAYQGAKSLQIWFDLDDKTLDDVSSLMVKTLKSKIWNS